MQSLPCNPCNAICALQFMLWALQKPFCNRCTGYVHLLQKQVSCISMLQGFWVSRAYLIFALQPLHCNLGSGRLNSHFVTGAWFPCTCYRINNCGFHVFALLFIALRLLRLPGSYPTTSPINLKKLEYMLCIAFALPFIASEATEATSELPDNQPYSFGKTGIHAFAKFVHCFSLLLRLLKLPRSYLTTSPINLKKLE